MSPEALEAKYMSTGGEALKKRGKKSGEDPKSGEDLERKLLGDVKHETSKMSPYDLPGSALVRGKDGRIVALNADERFITLKEANLYLADTIGHIIDETDTIQRSGLPEKDRNAAMKKLEVRLAAVKKLRREVTDAEENPASREAGYEGSEYLIENPSYQEEHEDVLEGEYEEVEPAFPALKDVKTEAWGDSATFLAYMKASGLVDERTGKLAEGYKDSAAWRELTEKGGNRKKYVEAHAKNLESEGGERAAAEDAMNVEGRERGVKELNEIKMRLERDRDAIERQLKFGGHSTDDLIKHTMNEMKRSMLEQNPPEEPVYPNYFPAETPKEKARMRTAQEVHAFDEGLREKGNRPVIRKEAMRKQEAANYLRSKGGALDNQREYPVTEEGEARRARGKEMVSIADELEKDLAPYKNESLGDALKHVLSDLDDVKEEISVAEKNLRFSKGRQKKSGSSREAA